MALSSRRKNTNGKISQNDMIYFVWRAQPKAQQIINEQQEYYKQLEKAYDKELRNLENPKDNPFIYDINKHQELQNLVKYTQDNTNIELLGKYEMIEKIHDKESSLDVSLYKNDKELVLVFPGSEPMKDFQQDFVDLYLQKINPQLEKAQEVLDEVKNNPEFENFKIILTGYSIGGNTAQILGAMNNINTVTFEPYRGGVEFVQKMADDKKN